MIIEHAIEIQPGEDIMEFIGNDDPRLLPFWDRIRELGVYEGENCNRNGVLTRGTGMRNGKACYLWRMILD